MDANSDIKTASYPFSCPLCGTRVKIGDSYVEDEGVATCPCVLPTRKLIPLAIIKELEDKVRKLELSNLHMKLDLDVLCSFPEGTAAKKISEKYRRIGETRSMLHISNQN